MTEVEITETAKKDIEECLLYIRNDLSNEKAASKLADEIVSQIELLGQHPYSGPVVQDDILAEKGIRFILIKNYKLYYIVIRTQEIIKIFIIRFLYARMDYENQIFKNFQTLP